MIKTNNFYGAWHNKKKYWDNIHQPDSEFKICKHMKMVCWFEIYCKLNNIIPGTYEILWKVKKKSHIYGFRKITTKVNNKILKEDNLINSSSKDNIFGKPTSITQSEFKNPTWNYYSSGIVNIKDNNIIVNLEDYSNSWKSSLIFDYCCVKLKSHWKPRYFKIYSSEQQNMIKIILLYMNRFFYKDLIFKFLEYIY